MPPYLKYITIFLLILLACPSSAQSSYGLLQNSATNGAGLKLEKKNDLNFSINSMKPSFDHSHDTYTDFQIGYSPLKYLGIQAGYYRFHSIIRNRESSKLGVTNLSVGTYIPIDFTNVIETISYYPRIFPDSLLLEFYGGFSLGKVINKDSHNDTPEHFHVADLRMYNHFVRLGLSYYLSKFSYNANYKWGYINFYKGEYDVARGFTQVFGSFNSIKADNDAEYTEITHQLSYHGKEIQIHVGLSNLEVSEPSNIRFKDFIWFGGLTFDIHAILNHNKNYNAQH